MDGRRARIVLGVGKRRRSRRDTTRVSRACARVAPRPRRGDRVTFELVVLAFETLLCSTSMWRTRLPARPRCSRVHVLRVDMYDSPARRRPPSRLSTTVLQSAVARQSR